MLISYAVGKLKNSLELLFLYAHVPLNEDDTTA